MFRNTILRYTECQNLHIGRSMLKPFHLIILRMSLICIFRLLVLVYKINLQNLDYCQYVMVNYYHSVCCQLPSYLAALA